MTLGRRGADDVTAVVVGLGQYVAATPRSCVEDGVVITGGVATACDCKKGSTKTEKRELKTTHR